MTSDTSSPKSRIVTHGLPLLIYLAAYYVISYPALNTMTTHLLSAAGDGLQNYWNEWWIRHAIAEGKNPWHTDQLFAPKGVTLIGATLNAFNGFVTVVLCWFVNPIVAFNLMVIFAFVVGGYTAFLLVRELTGEYWPSVVAGAVFTFCPYHFAHAMGHMQLVSLQWLPLFFYAWIRLLRTPGYGLAVLAAVALILNLLCDYYYTLYSVLGGMVLFAQRGWALRRPLFFVDRRVLYPLACFVAVSALSCGPILLTLLSTHAKDPFYGTHDDNTYLNDLFALFVHGQHWRFGELTEWYWSLHGVDDVESSSYIGLTVILLSTLGLVGSRQAGRGHDAWSWFFLGALFFAFSLGPQLLILGERYPGVPMPYDFLKLVIPGLEMSGMPIRMAVMTNLAAAVLTGFGMCYLGRQAWMTWRVYTPLMLILALEIWPMPQALHPVDYPPAIEKLREFPDGIVTGLAPYSGTTLLYQTRIGKPITHGYIARVPASLQVYRDWQIDRIAASQHVELMRKTGATYLVVERGCDPDVIEPELKCVAADKSFAVYTLRDNTLPEADLSDTLSPPNLTASFVNISATAGKTTVEIRCEKGASRPFFCAFSMSLDRARLYQGHRIRLKPDKVFEISATPNNPAFDNWGTFGPDGTARVTIDTSSMVEATQELWASVVVLERVSPLTVRGISPPHRLVLTK